MDSELPARKGENERGGGLRVGSSFCHASIKYIAIQHEFCSNKA